MFPQHDRQSQPETDEIYDHLRATAQTPQHEPDIERLMRPQGDTSLQGDYAYHPQDVEDLARWETKINQSIAVWLVLMAVISLMLVPFAPIFTPIVVSFFAIMAVLFAIRSQMVSEEQVESAIAWYDRYPLIQWMGASMSLTVSGVAYLMATLVPYNAVPASVQTLLFLVAMNFSIYTPIAIMRVIRQRTLRRKRGA